jgi:hypothetical protein
MADLTGLRIIGIIAASVTGAVMLIAAVMVHKTVAGAGPKPALTLIPSGRAPPRPHPGTQMGGCAYLSRPDQ